MNTAPLPIAVRVDEAARLVGMGKSSIYELLRDEKVEGRKWGRVTLVVTESLVRYVDSLPKVRFGV